MRDQHTIDNEIRAHVNKPLRAPPRPKRNDPCPCKSGKKFKHCCQDDYDHWLRNKHRE